MVCDARNRSYFRELAHELSKLKDNGITYRIIFMDAADDALLARYKASRRRHPMCTDNHMTIAQGIRKERAMLSELREIANMVIDTTNLRPIELRRTIAHAFEGGSAQDGLGVVVYSFGFKHGAATDADIVIDVRFLPNPYYDPELRHLTGLDAPVRDFVMGRPETQEFMKRWKALLDCVMPGYVAEGKQQLAIGVGCTGGQHRSVAVAKALTDYLAARDANVRLRNRDFPRT